MSFTCTKTFDCVSTAHRNWRAASNTNRDSKKCSFIHGYTKTFTFVFGCKSLDEFQWVYDYGTTSSEKERTMTLIKKFIQETLDHGVTTDDQDPMLSKLYEMHDLELIKLVVIPVKDGQSGSVEGLCRYIYNTFDPLLRSETNDRVWIESVTISEHHKNSSTYTRDTSVNISVQNTDNMWNSSPTFFDQQKRANEIENLHYKTVFDLNELSKTMGLDLSQFMGVPNQTTIDAMNDKVNKKSYKTSNEMFDDILKDENKETDKKKDEDFLDKILTKENLERGLKLLQFHPKYKAIATTLLMADDIKELLKNTEIKQTILNNPIILELLKKGNK